MVSFRQKLALISSEMAPFYKKKLSVYDDALLAHENAPLTRNGTFLFSVGDFLFHYCAFSPMIASLIFSPMIHPCACPSSAIGEASDQTSALTGSEGQVRVAQ